MNWDSRADVKVSERDGPFDVDLAEKGPVDFEKVHYFSKRRFDLSVNLMGGGIKDRRRKVEKEQFKTRIASDLGSRPT